MRNGGKILSLSATCTILGRGQKYNPNTHGMLYFLKMIKCINGMKLSSFFLFGVYKTRYFLLWVHCVKTMCILYWDNLYLRFHESQTPIRLREDTVHPSIFQLKINKGFYARWHASVDIIGSSNSLSTVLFQAITWNNIKLIVHFM